MFLYNHKNNCYRRSSHFCGSKTIVGIYASLATGDKMGRNDCWIRWACWKDRSICWLSFLLMIAGSTITGMRVGGLMISKEW